MLLQLFETLNIFLLTNNNKGFKVMLHNLFNGQLNADVMLTFFSCLVVTKVHTYLRKPAMKNCRCV